MPLSWSALHAQLLKHGHSERFERAYLQTLDRHRPDLPAGGMADLMAFLGDPAVCSEAKNRALAALVSEMQHGAAETATTLLVLALWPGLDAARMRLLRGYPGHANDLAGDLVGRLTLEIGRLDLSRVRWIAATLLRNVERDLRRDLQRRTREGPAARMVEELVELRALDPLFRPAVAAPAPDLSSLQDQLRSAIGHDAHLVLLVVTGGCTQREAAERLGIGHDAARKRYQRAMARLRAYLGRCPDLPF